VSASVNLPLHHKVQKFSSGTGSPGWSWKKGRKTVVWWLCGSATVVLTNPFKLLCFLTIIFAVLLISSLNFANLHGN